MVQIDGIAIQCKKLQSSKYLWTLRLGVCLFIYFALFLHKEIIFIYCNAQLIRCACYGYFSDHFRHLNACLSHILGKVWSLGELVLNLGKQQLELWKMARRGTVGSSPSQDCYTQRGQSWPWRCKWHHNLISPTGSTVNSHYTSAQLYAFKNNQLVHWSWQCNDVQILNSNNTL